MTEHRLREQQLEVLNRVLRHNLRNGMNAVLGRANLISEQVTGSAVDSAETIAQSAESLIRLGERARELETIVDLREADTSRIEVRSLVQHPIDRLESDYPEVDVSVRMPPDLSLLTYPEVLEIVLENVLENAAEHSDRSIPRIEVSASSTDRGIEFVIRDDGPGIPEQEMNALETGVETVLEHGSGLGLWVTKWGVRYLGGELSFEENEPRGSVVRIRIPDVSTRPRGPSLRDGREPIGAVPE